MKTRTLPPAEPERPARASDYLYRVLRMDGLGSGARHTLDGVDRIEIGRGERPIPERGGRALRLDCPDPFMSGTHAVLERERGHWVVRDAGSRNGIVVNGVRSERAIVLDSDVIELGRTALMLRTGQLAAAADHVLDAPANELATLDPELAVALAELARVATARVSVLVSGPTGAGKERVARAVHRFSGRAGPFVPVNCGALPPTLIESELFGHRRGAFSGAVESRAGLVLASDRGTLFLDEVADLPAQAQAALLRVLEERRVRAIGATGDQPVDLRVVAATHRDLPAMCDAGEFRDDLLARLAGFEISLPPLRERRVDIGLMLGELLGPGAALAAGAARALLRYDWPHNIRQLAQVIESAAALAGDGAINLGHLPDAIAAVAAPPSADPATDERAELLALLQTHRGNITRIAAALGRGRSSVQRLLKRHDLDAARYRD